MIDGQIPNWHLFAVKSLVLPDSSSTLRNPPTPNHLDISLQVLLGAPPSSAASGPQEAFGVGDKQDRPECVFKFARGTHVHTAMVFISVSLWRLRLRHSSQPRPLLRIAGGAAGGTHFTAGVLENSTICIIYFGLEATVAYCKRP